MRHRALHSRPLSNRLTCFLRQATWLTLAALIQIATTTHAQTPTVAYDYDDLGRLTAVVDPDGNAAIYSYDAVGNLLGIERVDAVGPLAITYVSPVRGQSGTSVVVFGKGFDAVPTNNTIRFFNNVTATVASGSTNRLVTSVPAGAATGRITVANSQGSATSPKDFVVGGAVGVTPSTAVLAPGQTGQFQATEAGSPTTNVSWSVNGIVGGDSSIGTISTAGLYTAPPWVPPGARRTVVTVTATTQGDRMSSASAAVTLINPDRLIPVAGGVSVLVPDLQTFVQSTDGGVSVQVLDGTTFVAGAAVAVTRIPVITGLTPASAARSTTAAVTLTGAGFTGATGLSITPSTGLTLSGFQVTNDTTATVQITSGTSTGKWALQLTLPGDSSTREGTGGNVFTVTP